MISQVWCFIVNVARSSVPHTVIYVQKYKIIIYNMFVLILS